MKLFTINIVAKSSLGFSSNLHTFSSSISSNSAEVKEKYATSDPEINADDTSSNKIANKLKKTLTLRR